MATYEGIINHDYEYLEVHKNITLSAEINQLQEECGELISALSKLKRTINPEIPTPKKQETVVDNVIEEMADVVAMIDTTLSAMVRSGLGTRARLESLINYTLSSKEERFVKRKAEQALSSQKKEA